MSKKILNATANADYRARGAAELPGMVERGVFGLPFFRVGGQKFFGNDRLDFLRQAPSTA